MMQIQALLRSVCTGAPAPRSVSLWVLACATTASASAAPAAACQRMDVAPAVRIVLGKSTIVKPPAPVARVLLGNADPGRTPRPAARTDGTDTVAQSPAAAGGSPMGNARPGVAEVDLMLFSPTEIYLLGKSLGSTNVVLLDRQGTCTAFDVIVSMDTSPLRALIDELMPNEKDIKIVASNQSIVLTGNVSDNEAVVKATELASTFLSGQTAGMATPAAGGRTQGPRVVNMLSVGSPQQVMLEVKVAEISKNLLDQFGIDFSRAFINGDGTAISALTGILGGNPGAIARLSGLGPNNVPLSSAGAVLGGSLQGIPGVSGGNVVSTPVFDSAGRFLYNNYTTNFGTIPARSQNQIGLNMQKTDGLVKVLAEPSVMAISGQTGSFLAGGKIFIPVSQSNANGGRDITLEEKEFGVSVKFTPTVLGNGRINLHVRPEVSELNGSGVTIAGLNGNAVLPAFTSRKAETTVQLADGQSFAIGGLVKNNSTANIKAFPFLGELPLIGALFRSTEFQTDKSELVFVITPRLVKPLPADFKLPTDSYVPPTRGDLILRGRLEGTGEPTERSRPAPAVNGFDQTSAKDKP